MTANSYPAGVAAANGVLRAAEAWLDATDDEIDDACRALHAAVAAYRATRKDAP